MVDAYSGRSISLRGHIVVIEAYSGGGRSIF
jgi:hypothetical protein